MIRLRRSCVCLARTQTRWSKPIGSGTGALNAGGCAYWRRRVTGRQADLTAAERRLGAEVPRTELGDALRGTRARCRRGAEQVVVAPDFSLDRLGASTAQSEWEHAAPGSTLRWGREAPQGPGALATALVFIPADLPARAGRASPTAALTVGTVVGRGGAAGHAHRAEATGPAGARERRRRADVALAAAIRATSGVAHAGPAHTALAGRTRYRRMHARASSRVAGVDRARVAVIAVLRRPGLARPILAGVVDRARVAIIARGAVRLVLLLADRHALRGPAAAEDLTLVRDGVERWTGRALPLADQGARRARRALTVRAQLAAALRVRAAVPADLPAVLVAGQGAGALIADLRAALRVRATLLADVPAILVAGREAAPLAADLRAAFRVRATWVAGGAARLGGSLAGGHRAQHRPRQAGTEALERLTP
jgi:hypothetical protein